MKHLTISALSLLSDTERKARRVLFDKRKTIILGKNQTGKSSLLKSLYHAIGAEPAKQHSRWESANVRSLIKFAVDDQEFLMIRQEGMFLLFAGSGRFIQSFSSVTKDLGPTLAQIFDFKLVLAARDESAQIPPPAFLYLPYYIDQDASWQNSWSGFSRLQQFTSWKTPVAEYHTGVRDNYYYELQATILELVRDVNLASQKVAGLRNVLQTLDQDARAALFDMNPTAFGEQIERLLRESELLLTQENEFKEQLSELSSRRSLHKSRLDIATRALGEIGGDFKFLSELPTEEIGCPTCGSQYVNDFAVRFAIATDEDRVAAFINQIRGEIGRLDTQISELYAKFKLNQEKATNIQQILAEKQGEVTLDTIIESEGRKSAGNLLRNQLSDAEGSLQTATQRHREAANNLRAHRQKLASTEDSVLADYRDLLHRNLQELEVNPLSQDAYDALAPQIREIGSMIPRTLLAYYFAILDLAARRSPSTVCPIVIDSPNQQAQDDHSLGLMLKFIADRQPENTQLILAIEKTMGVDLGGKLVELDNKYHLLEESEYDSVKAEFSSLLRASVKS